MPECGRPCMLGWRGVAVMPNCSQSGKHISHVPDKGSTGMWEELWEKFAKGYIIELSEKQSLSILASETNAGKKARKYRRIWACGSIWQTPGQHDRTWGGFVKSVLKVRGVYGAVNGDHTVWLPRSFKNLLHICLANCTWASLTGQPQGDRVSETMVTNHIHECQCHTDQN